MISSLKKFLMKNFIFRAVKLLRFSKNRADGASNEGFHQFFLSTNHLPCIVALLFWLYSVITTILCEKRYVLSHLQNKLSVLLSDSL